MKINYLTALLAAFLLLASAPLKAQKKTTGEKFRVSLQKRSPSNEDPGAYFISQDIQHWEPSQTAIIICDMWDKHWCTGATARVAEMAPRLNEVLKIAREKGMFIVHAPSDCMNYYKDYPQRKLAQKHYNKKYIPLLGDGKLQTEKDAVWPIDQSDEGCEDVGESPHRAWTKQIDALEINEKDAISDSGAEIAGLFVKRGIKNVILTGVHTNMCVIGRTFGLRNMVRLGMNVALMRDLTDVMYNSKMWPYVSHFTGNSLMSEYIETYVCPTIVSTDFTGARQFRFAHDKRPVVAFLTAEGEYKANQKLPEFGHSLLLKEGMHCDYAIGLPLMEGPGRHNLENLQILEDADIAVLFIRRIALEPEKMALIKNFVNRGKPVFGIRTASHAFDARGNVPREGGGITASAEKVSGFLEQWPEFDKSILGGNYQGHHAHLKEPTRINIVPGMENHPLLKNVSPAGFESKNWLYKNAPLASPRAQVLLTGSIPGEKPEPVLWINKNGKNRIVYTSLGHWDDWKIESVQNLFVNTIHYLLNDGK
ncbi:MAG: isochorismatase family protein [Chitinophagaceae bacterium]|nr:isochorismatase family protein [Chitinophagaceae bacterium]MCW5927334.1 isochorismatase family protein [Chitinophagaceae bacterium]